MIRLIIVLTALIAPSAAAAGPIAALVPIVVGALKVSAVVKIGLSLIATVAVSMLNKAKKPSSSGIKIDKTLQGGVNPRTIILGKYATSGSEVTPPMSYGTVNKMPNGRLVKVIAIADIPINSLTRIIINGEYVPVIVSGANRWLFSGKYFNLGEVRFYDGRQTTADGMLVSNLSSYPYRPWTSHRIGTGVAYAIFEFKYDQEVWRGEPEVKVEVLGAHLYDPRKDSSVGGSGSQRWSVPATWELTHNPVVMIYNILRGISLADGSVFGGGWTSDNLPLTNWVAAMNICDETVTVVGGGSEPRYRAGYEFTTDEEPADVIEELLKSCSGDVTESGAMMKIHCGPPGLPVAFVTDEDFLITKTQELDPFPSINDAHNVIHASFPHPEELWNPHDAPRVADATYIARDDGQELTADLQFPACPYPIQVQRNMLAWLKDDQRAIRHTGTLPHRAAALEPMDVIAWTSERNGYVVKDFEISASELNLLTFANTLILREVDPSDYDWSSDDELPDPVGTSGWDLPAPQPVQGFAAQPWVIKDADGVDRRPAIRCVWEIGSADDAFGLKIDVRIKSTQVLVSSITVGVVDSGEQIITEGILPLTEYEVRAKYIVSRATEWSLWLSVTTADIRLTDQDVDVDASIVEVRLSRESATVFAYADGTVQSYDDARGFASLWSGSTDVTDQATWSVQTSGLNGSINPSGEFVVTSVSTNNSMLKIIATYKGNTYTAIFAVSKVSAGYEIVSILPDDNLFEGRMVFDETTGTLMIIRDGVWTDKVKSDQLSEVTFGGTNLIQDGTFEQVPTTWSVYDGIGAGFLTFSDNPSGAPGNGRQVRMTAGANNRPLGITRGNVLSTPFIVDQIYVVSFWARPSALSPNITGFGLNWNPPSPVVKIIEHPTPDPNKFQRYVFQVKYTVAPYGNGRELFPTAIGAQTGDSWLISGLQCQMGSIPTVAQYLVADSVLANNIAAGQVTAAKLSSTQASIMFATIGDFQSAPTGARVRIRDSLIEVFYSNNVRAARFGVW